MRPATRQRRPQGARASPRGSRRQLPVTGESLRPARYAGLGPCRPSISGNHPANEFFVTTTMSVHVELGVGEVLFAVADTGTGIPDEQTPRLFERHWRGAPASKEGRGLGLYIVRGIVEAHGGRIWVDSVVGVGSTFFFTLPVPNAAAASVRADGEGDAGTPSTRCEPSQRPQRRLPPRTEVAARPLGPRIKLVRACAGVSGDERARLPVRRMFTTPRFWLLAMRLRNRPPGPLSVDQRHRDPARSTAGGCRIMCAILRPRGGPRSVRPSE